MASTRRLPTYGAINDGLENDDDSQEERGLPTSNGPSSSLLRRMKESTAKSFFTLFAVFVTFGCLVHVLKSRIHVLESRIPATAVPELMGSSAPLIQPLIPFEHVDRAEYGSTPAQDIVDPTLFDPSLRGDSSSDALLNVPFPTGAFWTNLVLYYQSTFSYPIMAYPYGYKWSSSEIQISYPPLRRLMDEISITDVFNPDLTLSAMERATDRHVMSWDPLSVTLRYYISTNREDDDTTSSKAEKEGYWETYLVQGSPYVTLAYKNATPVISALSTFEGITCPLSSSEEAVEDAVCSIVTKGQPPPPIRPVTITLKGTRFLIHTQENLTWMLVASETITLSFDNIHKTTISSVGTFSGVLRLALLPPPQKQLTGFTTQSPDRYEGLNDLASSSGVSRLACHANVYPVGGDVAWDSAKKKKDVATVHFRYDTKMMNQKDASKKNEECDDSTELLMLALPHHVQVLAPERLLKSMKEFDLVYRSIKGVLVPVLGHTWSYDEPLTSIGFESDASLQNAASLDDTTRRIILDQVEKDMFILLPTLDENVYGYGKQVARLAQLAHIASVLETPNEKGDGDEKGSPLTVEITKSLHKCVSAYLLGQNRDKLLFDTNFGGIISKDGLEDLGGDFGNGW
jgi:endo-1,3(4)-beta-glucanase